ncbi:hypothetical protein [Cronobacter phage vB_Cdu_VP8]|nr:hypothetical protein [Cronobacter phage vB_Cdu_VP8]
MKIKVERGDSAKDYSVEGSSRKERLASLTKILGKTRNPIVADEAILPKKQPKPEHVNVGTIGRVNLGKSCLSLAVAQLLGPQYAEISK